MEEARKEDQVRQPLGPGARRAGGRCQPGENGCGADMRFAAFIGEARKGMKMSLGLDQLVAECAAKRDIAVDVFTQRGSLPPQGCAISNRRLMSTLA